MKHIRISYPTACAEWNADRDARHGFRTKLTDKVAGRLAGGTYPARLRNTVALFRESHTRDSFRLMIISLSDLVCGRSLTRRVLGRQERAAREFEENLLPRRIPYRASAVLYHITDENNLDNIRERGLLSGVYSGQKHVFLTDDLKGMHSFLNWKTICAGRDVTYCVMEIDAVRLARERPLWYYRLNEIVTQRVEPQFIRWD